MAYVIVMFCVLGIIQGFTEFFPVSSSGHLSLLESIPYFNSIFSGMDEGIKLFFNVALHLASLCAIIIFYYHDIVALINGTINELYKKNWGPNCRFVVHVIIASIPAAIIGILFNDYVEAAIASPAIVSILLVANGIMLIKANTLTKKNRKCEEMHYWQAFFIGLFQAVAILPGISRSGSTIAGGLMAGLQPEEAGKFSFLMAIPVIAGAGLLESRKLFAIDGIHQIVVPTIIAMVVTFIAALLSLKLLIVMLKMLHLNYFGYYTIGIGLVSLCILYGYGV